MTWEELNRRCDYDFNKLILLMPEDVRKEIDELWNGGELNPYNAAEAVLAKRAAAERPVDLDEVYRKFEEEFGVKKRKPKGDGSGKIREVEMGRKDDLGPKTFDRAEVLAAMHCLVGHLNDPEEYRHWNECAIPDEYPNDFWSFEEMDRRKFLDLAKGMSDESFECICYSFASIIAGQCFENKYKPGKFIFEQRRNE
jgi:hypothetical protein